MGPVYIRTVAKAHSKERAKGRQTSTEGGRERDNGAPTSLFLAWCKPPAQLIATSDLPACTQPTHRLVNG